MMYHITNKSLAPTFSTLKVDLILTYGSTLRALDDYTDLGRLTQNVNRYQNEYYPLS